MRLLLNLIITINFATYTIEQLFTSTTDFELFLQHEEKTLVTLENFVQAESERIKHLKKVIGDYNKTLTDGFTLGVDNPVQFYLVMKDVIQKWKSVDTLLTADDSSKQDVLKFIKDDRKNSFIEIPMEPDLHMARVAISRIQRTYNLKHEDLVVGKINGNIKTNLELNARDCFEIGLVYVKERDYNNTLLWMQQAFLQLNKENDHPTVDRVEVLKYSAHASFKQGMSNKSVELMLELMKLVKDEESFYKHIRLYNKSPPKAESFTSTTKENARQIEEGNTFQQLSEIYHRLCNGEKILNHTMNSSLKCYYKKDKPFLRLASLKVEVLHINPDIFLFHNVISNEEISIITNISKGRLQQAQVLSHDFTSEPSSDRTAKVDWLNYDDHEILQKIDKRIDDMTNLDPDYAEILQTAHYDVGGHYALHFDAFGSYHPEESVRGELNDRIATVMFYLTVPVAGGATVFPSPKVALFPEKNSAILWYNLLKNGNPDENVMHAGCPVLSGKKWIANKWIRENGQEFRRKCTTNSNE